MKLTDDSLDGYLYQLIVNQTKWKKLIESEQREAKMMQLNRTLRNWK